MGEGDGGRRFPEPVPGYNIALVVGAAVGLICGLAPFVGVGYFIWWAVTH
jgi:hypothetical protein